MTNSETQLISYNVELTYKIGGSGIINITDGVNTVNENSIRLIQEQKKTFTLSEINVTSLCITCKFTFFEFYYFF